MLHLTSRLTATKAGLKSAQLARTLATAAPPMSLPNNDHANPTKYGGKYTVTLIPGDGIGQEIAESVKTVFKAAAVPVEWDQYDVSGFAGSDDTLLNQGIQSLRRNKVGLKGIMYTPIRMGHASFNVTLRKDLDIYASVASINHIPGYPTRHENVDFTIIRENTEGEYSGLEHQSYPGVVESLKIITREKTERIARFAFDFALRNGRKKVTCVHKANIMKLADGLFLNTCRRVYNDEYKTTGIQFNDMIVDNCAMQLVSKPQQFDVMVMPNLYGNIVSNIGAALVGGPGIVPGCNIGREYAIFEPGCRHVAKDIQGNNTANPTSMLLSSVMMLRHLNLHSHADNIYQAVYKTIKDGTAKTPDMGGQGSTTKFTSTVIGNL
ncbi:isocitrate dehydrogenase (NAD(+)) idh1 [Dimargaris verticillata]|uniref:Isocitrate dehydrogenase [NAD] subunit 1, mitochondrial n=1 Tax=Dimargaris verticillata TaxID=2761393 RepID=A0A9W8B775_9FUNG|nr:isocitrate dehydrogenase (NAD(+)) idh1 [Dimargaris verticillata]